MCGEAAVAGIRQEEEEQQQRRQVVVVVVVEQQQQQAREGWRRPRKERENPSKMLRTLRRVTRMKGERLREEEQVEVVVVVTVVVEEQQQEERRLIKDLRRTRLDALLLSPTNPPSFTLPSKRPTNTSPASA